MSPPETMGRRLIGGPPPAARVGVVGGGQLARMLHEAALPLNIEVRVLTDDLQAPAVRAGAVPVFGSAGDPDDLRALAEGCDVVTFDHEHASHDALLELENTACVRPSPRAKRMAQDKLYARSTLAAAGCPVPSFTSLPTFAALEAFADLKGWPIVLKARAGGYDGRGVWFVSGPEAARQVWREAEAGGNELLAEEHVAIDRELSVLVARNPSGYVATYPVMETVQRDATCCEVTAPAAVADGVAAEARRIATSIAAGLDLAGLLAAELFVTAAGRVLVNELALRPHNSGHLTIEGCATSQFEQHLRAILDWPLGSTRLLATSAAMVNLLGAEGAADPSMRLPDALAVPEVSIHLYGKEARAGRKLGHVTAIGDQSDDVLNRARAAAALLVR